MTMITKEKVVADFLRKEVDRRTEVVVEAVGEMLSRIVDYARDRDQNESWRNFTYNLRSSIGGALFMAGELVKTCGFIPIAGASYGARRGLDFARSLSVENPGGIVWVIVAGMDYSAKVESISNKDVLTSPERTMREEMKVLVAKMNDRFSR